MQRMNRMVLGLIAVFVLGGSLVLLSCGGDDTTDITSEDAASLLSCRDIPLPLRQTLMYRWPQL